MIPEILNFMNERYTFLLFDDSTYMNFSLIYFFVELINLFLKFTNPLYFFNFYFKLFFCFKAIANSVKSY